MVRNSGRRLSPAGWEERALLIVTTRSGASNTSGTANAVALTHCQVQSAQSFCFADNTTPSSIRLTISFTSSGAKRNNNCSKPFLVLISCQDGTPPSKIEITASSYFCHKANHLYSSIRRQNLIQTPCLLQIALKIAHQKDAITAQKYSPPPYFWASHQPKDVDGFFLF
jgi:hypothetical protein